MKDTSDKSYIFNIYSLHGFTGSGEDFSLLNKSIESQLEGLSVFINWYCPSLPGHGDSFDFDCSIQGQYNFLDEYIKTRGSHAKACHETKVCKNILIAYSMGSRLGLYHAIQQTDFWDAVVFIGVNPGIQSETERGKRREFDKKLSEKIGKHGLSWFLDYWKELPLIKTQSKAPDDFYRAMHERKKSLNAKGLQNSLVEFGQGVFPDLWGEMQRIQSPILLINGNLDVKYCEISQKISEAHTGAQFYAINDSGHAPHIENALTTAKAITAFLKQRLI